MGKNRLRDPSIFVLGVTVTNPPLGSISGCSKRLQKPAAVSAVRIRLKGNPLSAVIRMASRLPSVSACAHDR